MVSAGSRDRAGKRKVDKLDRSKTALLIGGSGAIAAADLSTKWLAREELPLYAQVPVVGEYLRLTHIYNPGAAFGIGVGEHSRIVFLALTLVALAGMTWMFWTTARTDRVRLLALISIIGGALGNFANRILLSSGVVDWIDVGVGTVRWPVFNLADVAITIGAVLLALSLWREEAAGEASVDSSSPRRSRRA